MHYNQVKIYDYCHRASSHPSTNGFCSKCGAANCMNLRGAKRIKYGQSAWVTGVPTFLVFYSILFCSVLFYVYITENNFTSLDKQSSFANTLSTPAETPIVLYYDFLIYNIKKQLAGKGSHTYIKRYA